MIENPMIREDYDKPRNSEQFRYVETKPPFEWMEEDVEEDE